MRLIAASGALIFCHRITDTQLAGTTANDRSINKDTLNVAALARAPPKQP